MAKKRNGEMANNKQPVENQQSPRLWRSGESGDEVRIKCDGCRRWAFLEESRYKDVSEAEEDTDPFICNICTRLTELENMHGMRTEELTALVSSLTEQIRRLEDQVASTASAATPELTHSGSGRSVLCQPVRSDGNRDGGDMDSHRGNAGEKDLEVQRSNREETKAPGETSTQQVNTAANVEQEKAAERTTDAGQQSLESTLPSRSSDGVRTDKRKHVDGAEEKGDATTGFQRPPQGVTREAIVVGDDNVPRFARALDREVGDSRRLEVLYNREATAEVAEKLIEDYESQARKVRRLYVLHVGIKDLLQGRRPEEIVDHLRNTWSKRSDVLAICAVPEVATRGKAVQAAAMSLNVKLGDLCQELRATYINLSKDLYHEDMTRDGLHYSQEGGRKVADRLARVISRFLGTRRRGRSVKQTQRTSQQSQGSKHQETTTRGREIPNQTFHSSWVRTAKPVRPQRCGPGDQEQRQNEATSQTEKTWPTHRPQHPAEQSFPQANPFVGLPPPPLLEPTHPQQWGPQPPVLVQRRPEVAPIPHLFSMVAHMVNCQLGHVLGRQPA